MLPSRRALASLVIGTAVASSPAGCSQGDDYYTHDPYVNGTKIDRGLVSAEQQMVRLIRAGNSARILIERTAPPWRARMRLFLRRYGGRPVVLKEMTPGDDATADEALVVTCGRGDVQRVTLSWAWFDGAWRAWPDYALTATGEPVEYPGCRYIGGRLLSHAHARRRTAIPRHERTTTMPTDATKSIRLDSREAPGRLARPELQSRGAPLGMVTDAMQKFGLWAGKKTWKRSTARR